MTGILLIVVCVFESVGCLATRLPEREPPPEPAEVPAPAGPLVYQPAFRWSDGKSTQQGTGFLARKLSGEVVGVTSAHFLDFDGPGLEQAFWLDVENSKVVAKFEQSYGMPGRPPERQSTDRRSDYLILFDAQFRTERPVLDFDLRIKPERRERVWLPDKRPQSRDGYVLIEGTVTDASENACCVEFDEELLLQSQSGSPIISQKTGKVIGTLSGSGKDREGTYVLVTPAHAILKAMRDAKDRPLLRTVVGKQSLPEGSDPNHVRQVPVPAGKLIFQPSWHWQDGRKTQNGTGCFVETPDGEIVGLTSAHFLDGADSALLEGDWIEIDSGKVRGAFNRSLGMPGHKPTGPDEFDRDYVVLTDDTPVFDVPTLTLDSRTLPAIGERIWMPNKDATSPDGYRLVAGTVSQTTVDYVVVNLDKPVVPQSQSGSPFISQTTGKIIGIWCATPKDRAGSQILLTPAAAIGKAIADAQTRPLLSEVIGKAK